MNMQSVESSNIKSAGYDPATETMQIEFLSGVSHSYESVSPDEWHGFEQTFSDENESTGKYFHENFRYAKKSTKL